MTAPSNRAIVELARVNPDDGTQVLVLRHANSTSTANDTTHIAVDLAAALELHVRRPRSGADIRRRLDARRARAELHRRRTTSARESFSNTAGDSVSVTFTGTAVRWISSYDSNHGIADVYLDGAKVATVDTYGASKATQQVFYAADGLANDDAHAPDRRRPASRTRARAAASSSSTRSTCRRAGANFYPSVPQQPGTAIRLERPRREAAARERLRLGSERLVYSTSELLTQATIGGRDVAMLYGRPGEDGETVLRYDAQPTVTGDGRHRSGIRTKHDLRLNYTHGAPDAGADRRRRRRRAAPLELIIGTDDDAARWWRAETSAGVGARPRAAAPADGVGGGLDTRAHRRHRLGRRRSR